MPLTGYFNANVRQQFLVIAFHLIALSAAILPDRTERDVSGQRGGAGVCTFGRSMSCCYGWRNVHGVCQPMCKKPCRKGVCVGPDKCSCHEGYEGKRCDEDVNECGLPTRLCSHSCMNTAGSYRCYCDLGYTLNTDGQTCTKEPGCSAIRCQYGCQVEGGGGVSCLCPPGLHLAADNRTCKDIDECQGYSDVCPDQRSCKNTFGSFVCVCRDGFLLGTLHDSVTCRDKDECLTGSHRCSRHASCINTAGSYTCRCEEEYSGDGFACWRRRSGQSRATMYFQYKLSKRAKLKETSL